MATFIEFQPKDLLAAIGFKETLELDACFNQASQYESDVTDHPIEDGSEISDHIIAKPRHLKIDGIVAYAPPRSPLDLATGRTLLDLNRHTKAHERLTKAWEEGELLTVHTGLEIYEDMAIVSYSPTREVKTGYDLVFSMELKEVKKVEAQSALVPASAFGSPKAKAQGASKGHRGAKPGKPSKSAASTSALANLIPKGLR